MLTPKLTLPLSYPCCLYRHLQRGLSLYYVKQYEEGARQFRDDVAVNPSDTEESIWCVE